MKKHIKSIIISSIFIGVVYAILMAWYNYSIGQEFKLWKFGYHASTLGISIAVFNYLRLKRKNKSS